MSAAAATRVSFPPARHHMSAKLPISAATRRGLSTVRLRPRPSVKVTAVPAGPLSALPEAEDGMGLLSSEPAELRRS